MIGAVDQIATDGNADQSSGVGFAVPSSLVSAELEQLEAGLTEGDVITEIDGEAVDNTEDLVAAIAAAAPGDTVELEIERDAKTSEVSVKLGTQPAESGRA